VNFLQNHDQTGNRALGERLVRLADRHMLNAAIALLLLCPQIPLIFMGEDSGADEPFLFFTDFHDSLADAVREGRRKEFAHSPGFGDFGSRAAIPDPNAITTFQASRVGRVGRNAAQWRNLYRDLLSLRAELIAPGLDGAIALGARAVGDKAVIAQWRLGYAAVLTLACNFGDAAAPGDFPAVAPVWGDRIDGALPAATTIAWIEPA
jgi:maltooligosyltrehalose trehalohydrolase